MTANYGSISATDHNQPALAFPTRRAAITSLAGVGLVGVVSASLPPSQPALAHCSSGTSTQPNPNPNPNPHCSCRYQYGNLHENRKRSMLLIALLIPYAIQVGLGGRGGEGGGLRGHLDTTSASASPPSSLNFSARPQPFAQPPTTPFTTTFTTTSTVNNHDDLAGPDGLSGGGVDGRELDDDVADDERSSDAH